MLAHADELTIAVLDYGIGNLRSAQKCLEHLGAKAVLTSDAEEIKSADGVVLPGVGAFGACMDALDSTGLSDVARETAASGRPFLGICVGMQLMYEGSDESPGRAGLGIYPGQVRKLSESVRVPQMQWNQLEAVGSPHPLLADLDGAWMYFVHSYAAEMSDATIATTDYGGPVVAAVAVGGIWATQFHPEKSADEGKHLLANWLNFVRETR